MSSFTITRLVGDRAIVRGTDVFDNEGTTTVSTSQWDQVNANKQFKHAAADFDAAVEAFFEPLTKAHEAMHSKVQRPEDGVSFVVLDEGEEAKPGRKPELIKLSRDSVILRLVEQGDTSRLVWVDDELEILEILPVSNGKGAAAPADEDAVLND